MTHSYIFFFVVMLILCIARFANVYIVGWVSKLLEKGNRAICK